MQSSSVEGAYDRLNASLDKYRPTGWKRKKDEGNSFDIELPSGQTCLARKLTVPDILRMGLMSRLDTFTGPVLKKATEGKKTKKAVEDNFFKKLSDPEKFADLEYLLDRITAECVIMPQVILDERVEDKSSLGEDVYLASEIDFFDKLKIFESVFDGMSEWADFRGTNGQALGSVADVEEAVSSTE